MAGNRRNRQASLEAWHRRQAFIQLTAETGLGPEQVGEQMVPPVSKSTYYSWREKFPDFAVKVTAARQRSAKAYANYWHDPSFVSFREHYLGMTTTWYQALVAQAIENARGGEITLVLLPPEHGKTTLLEDWCTYKLVTDPTFRITVASERVDHGIKVVSRVRERLEADGPTPEIARDFGPFAPESAKTPQEWGMKRFNVAQKKSDERDYSMSCIGMTGGVQGTRCDLLLLDDIQDLKSTELSAKYEAIIRQSFLSRPSMFGRTVIIGTRVDEYDVYRRLMDAELPDKVIRIPAYDEGRSPHWPAPDRKPMEDDPATWAPEGVQFLWPEMYDQEERGGERRPGLHRFRYAALRHRVGEQTWWRIYMQKPEAATAMTFDEATTDEMKDEHRSVIAHPRPLTSHDTAAIPNGESRRVPVIVTVDPSMGGGNGVLAAASRPKELQVLHCRLDYGLTKYAQIIEILEEECHRFTTETSFVSTVVVEANAFQKGILQDDRLLEVRTRFGFRLIPHTTSRSKSDPDIGIPSMPMPMVRREITLPWADPESQTNMAFLLDQLHMWRPGLKGNRPGGASKYVAGKDSVPQDLVMCLWFAYKQWRATRDTPSYPAADVASWRSSASPLRRRRISTTSRARRSGVRR